MPKIVKGHDVKIKSFALTEGELQALAHQGTKQAIDRIEAYIKSEKDSEKRSYAELALGECELFYYQPKNEKEEKDFTLCRLINEHERRIDDLNIETEKTRANLDKYRLEQKVHKQVLIGNKDKKIEWQYRFMDDFASSDENRLAELKNDIAYEEAWVEAAKKMIVSSRYKDGIPERHLGHYDFDDDWSDNDRCDCDKDGCPDCRSDDMTADVKGVPF